MKVKGKKDICGTQKNVERSADNRTSQATSEFVKRLPQPDHCSVLHAASEMRLKFWTRLALAVF